MNKIDTLSRISGGETYGILSAAAFGATSMWLLLCEKEGGSMVFKTGYFSKSRDRSVVIAAMAVCGTLPYLADTFKKIDHTVIEYVGSLFSSKKED